MSTRSFQNAWTAGFDTTDQASPIVVIAAYRPRAQRAPRDVVAMTLSANWSGAQWLAPSVHCTMAAIAGNGDGA